MKKDNMTQQSTLRILARNYSDGKIDKDKYRTSRTSFFESLVSGDASLPVEHEIDEIAEKIARGDTFSDITSQKSVKDRPEEPQKKRKEPDSFLKQNSTLIFGGAGTFIVIILLLVIFSGGDESPTQASQSSDNNQSTPAIIDAPPSPLQNHVASFLSENLWSQGNLDAFIIQWQSFSDLDRSTTMNSTEFSRLVNAISKKLLEERALAAIGNPETSYEKQRQLVEFANTIGIQDQRITLPDAP